MAPRPVRRRRDLPGLLLAGAFARARVARSATRRWRIALANLDETPGVTLEGLGFTGLDVRRSFEMAARTLPVDMVYYDNAGDAARALANADAAIAAKLDLVIEYNADAAANIEIARRLAAAHIPIFALVDPVPGAPLYGPDNLATGRIAGRALGAFARQTWPGEPVLGVMVGDFADPGAAIRDRARGITEGVREALPMLKLAALDTGGQSPRADALMSKFLLAQGGRVLIGALDDLAAIYAARAIEMNRRQNDCIIVSQGLDPNIHGCANEKKAIDPNNRSSVVLGSVAYYMDRYGYEVLPLALRLLAGAKLPQRTLTQHRLITAENVFEAYPPIDMN
jgi:ABC-type sugar transport system substrate-binding protein